MRVTSLGGFYGPASSPLSITIDLTGPAITADQATVAVAEGALAGNTGVASDLLGGGVRFSASFGVVTHIGGAWSWTFTTTDGPANNQTVTITATDDAGNSSTVPFSLVVNNSDPTIDSLTLDSVIEPGTSATLRGAFHDPGIDDTHSLAIDWDGDYVTDQTVPVSNGSFSVPHVYATAGTFTVHVSLADDDGGVATQTTSLIVQHDSLRVVNFQPTSSGFDVSFNRAPKISDLQLYNGMESSLSAADLTVVGTSVGAVAGSLVWNSSTNTLSFVQNGGVLANDTYEVRLLSGSLGFHDLNGEWLDGNGNRNDTELHDDYIQSLVINALSDTRVASIHDFARGPGQAIDDLPSVPFSRLAVRLSNAADVQSLAFEFHYDPALLSIAGATLASGMPGDWTITADNTIAGILKITASGTLPLSGTDVPIVLLDAKVPLNAPYGAAEVLRITQVHVNADSLPGSGDFAVHNVTNLGDADGSGAYSAADVVQIQQVAALQATGFDSQHLISPVTIASVSSIVPDRSDEPGRRTCLKESFGV